MLVTFRGSAMFAGDVAVVSRAVINPEGAGDTLGVGEGAVLGRRAVDRDLDHAGCGGQKLLGLGASIAGAVSAAQA